MDEMIIYAKPDGQEMTLRDYFAAHAPIDWRQVEAVLKVEVPERTSATKDELFAAMAALRHEYADAMMKARQS